MTDHRSLELPDLGTVQIVLEFSAETVQSALDAAHQAPQAQRSLIFANSLLSALVVSPPLSPDAVSALSKPDLRILVYETAKMLMVPDEYQKMPPEANPREKLYKAYFISLETWAARNMKLPLQTLYDQSRASHGPIMEMARQRIELENQLQASLGPIREMAKQHLEIMKSVEQQLLQSLRPVVQATLRVAESIREKYEEADQDAQAANPLLIRSNLWFPPSAPQALLQDISRLSQEVSPSSDQVEALFLDYFRDDEWTALRDMCESWEEIPIFVERMHIINDALAAHINGKYTLSVPSLLPQFEGVAAKILGNNIAHGTGNHIARLIRENYPDVHPAASKDPLIKFVVNHLFIYINFDTFGEELESQGIKAASFLHRHAILHGVHLGYAAPGLSLRAFLLLDALSYICDANKP